jgi:dTDP-4-amino-4,6-dideoxygalactose transaminase
MKPEVRLPNQFDRSGRDLGAAELAYLQDAIESGCLICTRGKHTDAFEKAFAEVYGVPYARALASGTAAVHVAVAAIDPQPGDEIITTPITDFGALAPILFQGAVPVFADVDPVSLNITPESVQKCITPHTKAVLLAHLFGTAADVEGIIEVCRPLGIPVIEDAAQAFLAHQNGKLLGTIGDIGCFSFQQGKQMTCGEGGAIITKDPQLHQRMWLFTNKGWGYNDPGPDHWFLALNYRITELQSAVLRAQLEKLPGIVARRQAAADQLTTLLHGTPGLALPKILPGCDHSWWRYTLSVDPDVIPGGARALGTWLNRHGCPVGIHYVGKPAYKLKVFAEHRTFGQSGWPWNNPGIDADSHAQARGVWNDEDFPGTLQGLDRILVFPWNEFFTATHVEFIADRILNGVAAVKGEQE